MEIENKTQQAKQLYKERKDMESDYNQRLKDHKEKIDEFFNGIGETEDFIPRKELEQRIPRFKELIEFIADRDKVNLRKRKLRDIGSELIATLNREVRTSTIVLSEAEEGGCAITFGSFGYGIRKNVQSQAIESMSDVMEVISRADEVCATLEDYGYDTESEVIRKLSDVLEPVKYMRNGWSIHAEIPLTPTVGFSGNKHDARPINVDTMYLRRSRDVMFADTSIGKYREYVRHSVYEADKLLVENVLENDSEKITEVVAMLLDTDLDEVKRQALDAVKKQRLMMSL